MIARRCSWLRFAAFIAIAGTSGCYKATFYQNPQATNGTTHEEWTNFFLFGLAGSEVVDVRKYCAPGTLAVVRTGANAGTALVSIVTLGIYTPHKVYVTCAAWTPYAPASAMLVPARTTNEATP